MHNYPYYLNTLTTFIYMPVLFAYIIPMMYFGTAITPEQRAIPQHKFAVMGALDSLAGVMQSFATNYITSGSLLILLQQSAIPMSMVISYFLLKVKYKWYHIVGACVVGVGLITVLLPKFIKPSDGMGENLPLWVSVMILSCIPMCLSSVYKEKALGEVEIDAMYLNGWIAVWQFLFSIPLAIPSAYAQQIPLKELPSNFYGGMKCYMGINSLPSDDCGIAPFYVNTYLAFNICYNILIILILKFGSANILWMAMTVMVPLGNAAFALRFVPGHKPLGVEDIIGLIVILGGICMYRFYDVINDWRQGKKKATVRMRRVTMRPDFIESAEFIIDSVTQQRDKLERSHMQIRGSYLSRLGVLPHQRMAADRAWNSNAQP